MKRILQVRNGVAVSEWSGAGASPVAPEGWTFIDVTDNPAATLGCTYDTNAQTFTPPPAEPDYGRTVTVRQFLSLFTIIERKAIRNRVLLDDDVADWFSLFIETAEPIRLKHPDTIAGLTFLVGKTLLTAARRTAIANG